MKYIKEQTEMDYLQTLILVTVFSLFAVVSTNYVASRENKKVMNEVIASHETVVSELTEEIEQLKEENAELEEIAAQVRYEESYARFCSLSFVDCVDE